MSLDLLTKQSNAQVQADAGNKKAMRTMPSWLVPSIILAGFAAIFIIVLWDDLKPSVKVETARAIALVDDSATGTAPKDDKQSPARLLFQAAGWLEPDPLPVKAGALINGSIEDIPVREGDLVKKGATLATLIDEEFRIAVKQTHAAHMEAEATVRLREAEIKTAQANLRAEGASLDSTRERLKRADISYKRYSALKPDTVSAQTITDAEQELRELEKLVLAGEAKLIASETALEEARAKLDSAIALDKKAEQACDKAKLDLQRCTIASPINGRILRLNSSPGARVNASGDDPESGLIATLYDPESIALKMDVPLDQAGKLSVGQQAIIRCEVFPNRIFTGTVTRVAGEADIQRNTLQARVRLNDPDDKLRPGMACRAEIYTEGVMPKEGQEAITVEQAAESQPVLIPSQAIIDKQGNSATVWIISVEGRLAKKSITLDASKDKEGLSGVASGILPGEPVIINPGADMKEGSSAQSIN